MSPNHDLYLDTDANILSSGVKTTYDSSLDVELDYSSLLSTNDIIDKLSSPSNNLRRSKCNRVKKFNIYGGKDTYSYRNYTLHNNIFIQSLDWSDIHTELLSSNHMSLMNMINKEARPFPGNYEDIYPMLFASKLNTSDNPNCHSVVNGPDADGCLGNMDLEYNTLHDNINTWTIIPRT